MERTARSRKAQEAFTRVSGMPRAYFTKVEERYPASDVAALRVFLALRNAARRADNAVTGWLGKSDLTVTKLDVLHLLNSAAPEALTVSQLSNFLRMTQPNITYVMHGLERERLIKRSIDPGDRRSSLFSLTRSGLARMEEITDVSVPAIGRALKALTPAERARFIETLAAIAEDFEAVEIPGNG